jgi:hypothetical protein
VLYLQYIPPFKQVAAGIVTTSFREKAMELSGLHVGGLRACVFVLLGAHPGHFGRDRSSGTRSVIFLSPPLKRIYSYQSFEFADV